MLNPKKIISNENEEIYIDFRSVNELVMPFYGFAIEILMLHLKYFRQIEKKIMLHSKGNLKVMYSNKKIVFDLNQNYFISSTS